MSEMVERVAKAIHKVNDGRSSKNLRVPWEQCIQVYQELLRNEARAAIEAMREPTKQMIDKGLTAISDNMETTRDSYSSYDYAVEGTAYHGWAAMIDEALK